MSTPSNPMAPAGRKRTSFNRWSGLAALALVGTCVIRYFTLSVRSERTLIAVAAGALIAVLLALAVGAVVFVASRRSNRAFNIAFAAVLTLGTLLMWWAILMGGRR